MLLNDQCEVIALVGPVITYISIMQTQVPLGNLTTPSDNVPHNQHLLIHVYVHDANQYTTMKTVPINSYLHHIKGVVCVTVRKTSNLHIALALMHHWSLSFRGILHVLASKRHDGDERIKHGAWSIENDDDVLVTLIASRPSVEQADARLPLCNPTLEFVHDRTNDLDTCRRLVERGFSSFLGSFMLLYTTQGMENGAPRENIRHTLRSMRTGCISLDWSVDTAKELGVVPQNAETPDDEDAADIPISSVVDAVNKVLELNHAIAPGFSGIISSRKNTRVPRCGKCLHCIKKHWRKSCLMSRRPMLESSSFIPIHQGGGNCQNGPGIVSALAPPRLAPAPEEV